ncbi:(Na+)-NQR maturation NqrM [Porticoccus sp.]
MLEILLAFVLLLLIVVGMAIGVIMGRKPLKGSCGGVGNALGEKDYSCPLCGDDPNKCEEINQPGEAGAERGATSLSYDASKVNR